MQGEKTFKCNNNNNINNSNDDIDIRNNMS